MLKTGTTKYYLLSVFGALVLAVGVLAVAPSAQAQMTPPPEEAPSIDKECSPNPAQVGQQITCTIDLVADPETLAQVIRVEDTLPPGLTVIGATSETTSAIDGIVQNTTFTCTVSGNNVECPQPLDNVFVYDFTFEGVLRSTRSYRVTIEARAEQCGTFQNTARAEGNVAPTVNGVPTRPFIPFAIEDTKDIIVVGCEGAAAPGQQQQPGGGGGSGGGASPITQEGEQESEAGEIDQSFDVS